MLDSDFIRRFSLWLLAEFVIAATSAVLLGPLVPPSAFMPLFLGLLATLLVSGFLAPRYRGINPTLAVIVPAVLGVFLFAACAVYISLGAAFVVVQAGVGTVVLALVVVAFALRSAYSLERFTPILFGTVLAMIVMQLLNYYVFHLPLLHTLIAALALVVFSMYLYIHTQKVVARARREDGLPASYYALAIFIDIYNLFASLLEIFGRFR